jgi:hypothetical protein
MALWMQTVHTQLRHILVLVFSMNEQPMQIKAEIAAQKFKKQAKLCHVA